MPSLDDSELVVNHRDACMYGRDLKLLQSPTGWLNDSCIHYYMQRLQYPEATTSDGGFASHKSIIPRQQDVMIDPAVVSWFMHQCIDDDEIQEFNGSQNNWVGVERIFMPINDNMGQSHWTEPGLGTHWSLLLLVVDKRSQTVYSFHIDSLSGKPNHRSAVTVVKKWWDAFIRLKRHDTQYEEWKLWDTVEVHGSVQTNGYDCGLHVLDSIRKLMRLRLVLKYNDTVDALASALSKALNEPANTTNESKDKDRMFLLRREIVGDVLRMAGRHDVS